MNAPFDHQHLQPINGPAQDFFVREGFVEYVLFGHERRPRCVIRSPSQVRLETFHDHGQSTARFKPLRKDYCRIQFQCFFSDFSQFHDNKVLFVLPQVVSEICLKLLITLHELTVEFFVIDSLTIIAKLIEQKVNITLRHITPLTGPNTKNVERPFHMRSIQVPLTKRIKVLEGFDEV